MTSGGFDAAAGSSGERASRICFVGGNMDHALAKLARTIDWGFWKRSSARCTPTALAGRHCRPG
jgi:hypothetical protein